jgi:predicted peptidase
MAAWLSPSFRRLPLNQDGAPKLAPGAPNSPERTALIETLKRDVAGLDSRFSPHTYASGSDSMPYRIFAPSAPGDRKLPLVVYLHGSAGLGTDNQKQMGAGNVLGTRVWATPANQERFPCYVVVPQTDEGWIRYGQATGANTATVEPGLGEGARKAFALLEDLLERHPIDARRIYLSGQSLGGAGAWHMLAERTGFFAAAAICCGSQSLDSVEKVRTPIWNFHGDADAVVDVSVSRERLAVLRKTGARPIGTEYAGVGHNVWDWAFSEPALLPWLFGQHG